MGSLMAVSERDLLEALAAIVSALPAGGEIRPGQREMGIEINKVVTVNKLAILGSIPAIN